MSEIGLQAVVSLCKLKESGVRCNNLVTLDAHRYTVATITVKGASIVFDAVKFFVPKTDETYFTLEKS